MAKTFMRFPGGRSKALTLSYDDGVEQDIRLIGIMKKHGLKGTFNLNSGLYAPENTVYPEGTIHKRMSRSMAMELYLNSGMEIAVHGLTHPHLEQLSSNLCTYEILQDRINLEKEYGFLVRGMAYPCGTYSDGVVESAKQCGIVYARTIVSSGNFEIPTDWLRIQPTCRHKEPELMDLAHRFVESAGYKSPKLFLLWGHSYEFDAMDNWSVIEEFAEYIGGRNDIWYATNIEIYDYIAAYHQLIFNMGGTKVYNPTCIKVYFETLKGKFCVNPGEITDYVSI